MKHIILIGMRGAGKTYTGKKISEYLKMPFLDTDELIVKQEGRTIEQIVQDDGWDCFRNLEYNLLENLQDYSASVIATGGGLPVFERNQDSLKNLGFIVWICTPIDVILQRLAVKTENRPALTNKNWQDEIVSVYNKRESIYKSLSQYCFLSDNLFEEELQSLLDFFKKQV